MSWRRYKLGDILKRRKETIKVQARQDYKLVTVKLYHKGVVLRRMAKGSEIKSSMSVVKEGDFILSGIDARNGAFGIVPRELDGAIVTNDFWCLDPDEQLIDKEFLLFLTGTQFFDHICKQSSEGTTQRIRLQKDKFFGYEIDLPSVQDQRELVQKLKSSQSNSESLSAELTHQLDLVKQLRQAFLREAMQGKLVPQDSNDEPASELLKRIKAEKARLIKEGKLKKEKELPPIRPEEVPFKIPESWVWCRLGEVCKKITDGTHHTPTYKSTGIPFLSVKNISQGRIDFGNTKYISLEQHNELTKRCKPEFGDLLLTKVGTTGIAKLVDTHREFSIFVSVALLQFDQLNLSGRFLEFMLNSPFVKDQSAKGTWGVGNKNLVLKKIEAFLIALPPTTVQSAIVAKLDNLMHHCDELGRSIKQSQAQNEQLLQQVLREALSLNRGVE